MEKNSSNGWKFFAILFGALLAGVVGLYVYKQQNPDYDPWEEPWRTALPRGSLAWTRPRRHLSKPAPPRLKPLRKPPDSRVRKHYPCTGRITRFFGVRLYCCLRMIIVCAILIGHPHTPCLRACRGVPLRTRDPQALHSMANCKPLSGRI